MADTSQVKAIKGRIDSIQALRFIAAILVVGYHLPNPTSEDKGWTLSTVFHWGGYGVDIFFVVSGFIITYAVVHRDRFSATLFLRDRIDRIFPVYWVVLLVTIAISLLQSHLGIENLTATFLTLEGYLTSILLLPLPYQIMPVAWTLGMEMTFYILFATGYRLGGLRFVALLVLSWYAVAFLHARSDPFWNDGLYVFFLHSICLEFLFGMGIAVLYIRKQMPLGWSALALGIVLTLLIMPRWNIVPTADLPRELQAGIPAALIVYGVVALAPRTPRWLVLAGEASYALYLTHTLVLALFGKIALGLVGVALGSSVSLQALAILVCVIVSIFTLIIVERPLRGILRASSWRPRWRLNL